MRTFPSGQYNSTLPGRIAAIWHRPASLPVSFLMITGSPSRSPRAAASAELISTSSRRAPTRGSNSFCTIELNCFPLRVLKRNHPGGTSMDGGRTAVKRARPSGFGKRPPSHRRGPPHWIASPFVLSRWIPSYSGRTFAISSRISWASSKWICPLESGRTRSAKSMRISHSDRLSPTWWPWISGEK